jgi:hypothetical protein
MMHTTCRSAAADLGGHVHPRRRLPAVGNDDGIGFDRRSDRSC